MPPIKVDLPPPPNFNIQTAPEKYPSGEMSIYGLRKHMSQYLDKDVQVKAYLLQIYECPAEQRKCNDELANKAKKEKKKELDKIKKGKQEVGAAPASPIPNDRCSSERSLPNAPSTMLKLAPAKPNPSSTPAP